MRLRAHAVAKVILGDDMAFDFDMLLSKVWSVTWISDKELQR